MAQCNALWLLLTVLILQKNVEVEREVEKELEGDAVPEYVMMSDDDSDAGGTDVEVHSPA
jgi:hypothetical protein